jgi:hypothetical protein
VGGKETTGDPELGVSDVNLSVWEVEVIVTHVRPV